MGASNSKIDEDKALQLCRERKKFVRQALDGRCSLAAAHVTYIHSLRNVGTALRKFIEHDAPIGSSLYTSTSATPEPLALAEKSISHFSFSSPSLSRRIDISHTTSPSPSPPPSTRFQAHHMKFRGSSSRKVEEKPSLPITATVTSLSSPTNTTPHSVEKSESSPFEAPILPPGIPPWDYFGLSHPIDNQFSSREGLENFDDARKVREEKGIPKVEDEEEESSFHEKEESEDSEDEFDEPSTDTLVRRFENLNRVHDRGTASVSPITPSARNVASESEFLNGEKGSSPDLAPLKSTPSVIEPQIATKKASMKEDGIENKVLPKDFFSSIKDIEYLFIKASESGREVPKMLEANKLHFRPIFPGKTNGSVPSTFFSACFSCGEEKIPVQEEPAETGVKYLTWHRTTSSRSSSSKNPLGSNSKDDVDDFSSNLFDNFCMNSGSHASTLDRLYAWERKLSDEVKASQIVRKEYNAKCKILRELESNGESSYKIDKVRAVVKDLHSRIRVAIHSIDSISNRIEELRDRELQPQLEELIQGLSRMWEVMYECHKLQYRIISVAIHNSNSKISSQSESRRHVTVHLESELSFLSSSFSKWIGTQKSYLHAVNGWLLKCVLIPNQPSKRKRRRTKPQSLKDHGPPIYTTCDVWLDKLGNLPADEVVDSIKNLAAETSRLLPSLEKNQGKSRISQWKDNLGSESAADLLRAEAPEDGVSSNDRFRSSLVGFLGQLNNFAESSVKMYGELEKEIQDSKSKYEQWKSQSQSHSQF